VLQQNFIIVNQISNKMIFSINMLGPLVEDKTLDNAIAEVLSQKIVVMPFWS